MPTERFKRLSRERQKQIIAVAAAEFAEHGYEGSSLNRIIQLLGSSKGALYYYFNSKEDLFVHTINTLMNSFTGDPNVTAKLCNRDTFWEDTLAFSNDMLNRLADEPQLQTLYRQVLGLRHHPTLAEPLTETFLYIEQWHRRFLQAGQACGAIRTDLPFDLLVAMTSALDTAVDQWTMEQLASMNSREEMQRLLSPMGTQIVGILKRMLTSEFVE